MNTPKLEVQSLPCFVHTLFCDDIRIEVGNKKTLVGVYNNHLFLTEFPTFIPKLAVCVFIETPIEEKIKSFTIIVEKDDEIIHEQTSEPSYPDKPENRVVDRLDKPTRRAINVPIFLPPLTVMSPCMLRVKTTLDGVEFITGKLHIRDIPSTKPLVA